MEKGLVSIIVPVYNREEYLEYCLRSLVSQTYPRCEIILIDDGSSDGSGAICDQYAQKEENIIVLHYQNEGVSEARNHGLDRAKGEFICFVDSDDWLSSNMISYLCRALNDETVDMAMCKIMMVYERKAEAEPDYNNIKKIYQNREEYLTDNFLQCGNSCCAKIFRRRTLERIRFQKNLTIGEDMLYLLAALEHFKKVVTLDFFGYYYLQIPTSAMNNVFHSSYMDQIYCWEKAYAEAEKFGQNIQNRISAIIIVSAFLVLNKIALLHKEERPKEYCKICRDVILNHARGRKYLTQKQKIQYSLCIISDKLYLWCYHKRKKP